MGGGGAKGGGEVRPSLRPKQESIFGDGGKGENWGEGGRIISEEPSGPLENLDFVGV